MSTRLNHAFGRPAVGVASLSTHKFKCYEPIDKVRNMELAKAKKEEQKVFRGTKYLRLSNRANVRGKNRVRLDELLKVNQALTMVYLLKDDLRHLWDYRYEGWASRLGGMV